jgi:ADP-heptose:LPS heptosyltransferase
MHLASLAAVPVVSIWGATHPSAGFLGWGQQADNAIGLDLDCRPCSIYGQKACRRGDYACLSGITPQTIVDKVNLIINNNKKPL